ncbi:MAG: 5-oxoprolinase subunit PxpB [Acidobacteriota bacterium]|nr:5-oxoprolinase subunit PxpB [Acidobacteriota bacterium]
MNLRTRDISEGSFLVDFPGRSDSDANRTAVSLAERLSKRRAGGVLDSIPGARTLFVLFDPHTRDSAGIVRLLGRLAAEKEPAVPESRLLRIPVAYGAESGPDLLAVARDRGLDPAELCRRHARAEYRVAFLGFSPGFAYLTGLPPELAVPRLESPRPRVPAGSVAIAGEYSAIYPAETPGGWRLIGRSPVSLFDPAAEPPALFSPGDRVSFEPIGEGELLRRLAERRAGEEPEATGEDETLFEVVTPGPFTSIQGAPRFGLGRTGVPAGGAMDPGALAAGNARVGNRAGAAALEVTLSGLELALRSDGLLALAGADLDAKWNGNPAPFGEPFSARKGDRISFGRARIGARAYLCVAGGLAERRPAETTRRLARGDRVVRAGTESAAGTLTPALANRPPAAGGVTLRVLSGPQADVLEATSADRFFRSTYRVSPESDRRGIRLDGPALDLCRAPDVPPEGTALGTIQVPANGLPIVLGPDRPVTGGYAKIATVIARDWSLLAQAPPGTAIRFRPVTLSEAMEELR